MAYVMIASAMGMAIGLLFAPLSPILHAVLTGYYGGLLFPLAVLTTFATGMASGRPRRGLEALLLVASLAMLFIAPLPMLGGKGYAVPALTALALLLLTTYIAWQAMSPRAARFHPILWVVPPITGLTTAVGIYVFNTGESWIVDLALVIAVTASATPLVMAPLAVGASIYGLRAPRGLSSVRLAPAYIFPLTSIAVAASGRFDLIALMVAGYVLLMNPFRVLPRLLGDGVSNPRGYLLAVHASSLSSASMLAIGFNYLGFDVLTAVHVLLLGHVVPHAMLHSQVRGGEVPLTRRPRSWMPAAPLAAGISALLRPLDPELSLAMILSALAIHYLILASPRDLKPRAFKPL